MKKMETAKVKKTHQLPKGVKLLGKPENSDNDFQCVRCGHEWQWRLSEKKKLPERCPHCSSPFWNKHYVRSPEGRTARRHQTYLPSALPPSMQK